MVIFPAFLTPLDEPFPSKLYLSLMKSLSLIFNVEAVNDLVFTVPLGVITTPFGFTSITLPFEFSCPAIVDGVEPFTLFNEKELADGWLKSTLPLL